MSEVKLVDGVYEGPVRAGSNWSRESAGSIHDDATASKLGFRGGTVAGSIHMNQFVPPLLEAFGEEWFRSGFLSLYFVNATTHGEPVQVFVKQPAAGETQVPTWMKRADEDTQVAVGHAGLGDTSRSELRTRDLRPGNPDDLRILKGLAPAFDLGTHTVALSSKRQSERIAAGEMSEPIPWYTDPGHWGGLVASPSAAVELLWAAPTSTMRPIAGPVVGLFGAIEIAHVKGPIILDETYEVTGQVVAVGQSPKTEYMWFDSSAKNRAGDEVARMRMLLRFMKASSDRYKE
ncbi:MAG: hypothetical protein ACM3S1_04135 [Hyphomicrobiales bacterium]